MPVDNISGNPSLNTQIINSASIESLKENSPNKLLEAALSNDGTATIIINNSDLYNKLISIEREFPILDEQGSQSTQTNGLIEVAMKYPSIATQMLNSDRFNEFKTQLDGTNLKLLGISSTESAQDILQNINLINLLSAQHIVSMGRAKQETAQFILDNYGNKKCQ